MNESLMAIEFFAKDDPALLVGNLMLKDYSKFKWKEIYTENEFKNIQFKLLC